MYKFQRDGRKLKNIRFNQYLHRVERGDLRMNSNRVPLLNLMKYGLVISPVLKPVLIINLLLIEWGH